MVGVQWHPEELTATPEPWDRRLFAAFAAACRAARQLSIHFPSIRTWRISFSGEWWFGKSSASLMLLSA